jgi:GR25 family glycosyltransferase involved in LPS biosynthesis
MENMSNHSAGEIYKHILKINSIASSSEKKTLLSELLSSPQLGSISHSITSVLLGMIYDCDNPPDCRSMPDNIEFKVITLKSSGRIFDFYDSWPLANHVSIFEGTNARSQYFKIDSEPFYNSHIEGKLSSADLGHIGCTLSHFKLWDSSEIATGNYLCVLEDDALMMPYARNLFPVIIDTIPSDADIVFVNGRSSEKLYISSGEFPPYDLPGLDLFVKKSHLYNIMNNNFSRLPKGLGKVGQLRHWSGTDGYILSNKGLDKLKQFIHTHGIPPIGNKGAACNIDCILSLLTASKSDIGTHPLGFDVKNKNALELIDNTPYLKGYVTRYPMLDARDNLGYARSRDLQAKKSPTENEINTIRDVAFSMPASMENQAINLLEVCHKYRPKGTTIKKRLDELKYQQIKTAQISIDKRLIFVHIPKCGGTSIDNSGLFSHKVLGHRSFSTMIKLVEPYSHDYRVLTLCRNPWDRLASAFHYLSKGGCGNALDLKLKSFVDQFNGNLSLFLESFCENPVYYFGCMHMKPAVSFIKPSTCTNPLFIQKLEEISDPSAMFAFVGEKFQIRHDRQGPSSSGKTAYTESTFQRVREIYYEDCLEFGYLEYTHTDILK